jgi:hypothetical protein
MNVFKRGSSFKLIDNIFVFTSSLSLQLFFPIGEFIKAFSFWRSEMLFNKLIKLPWEFNHEVDDVLDDSHENTPLRLTRNKY